MHHTQSPTPELSRRGNHNLTLNLMIQDKPSCNFFQLSSSLINKQQLNLGATFKRSLDLGFVKCRCRLDNFCYPSRATPRRASYLDVLGC